jgi:hypothetical protein
VRKDDTRQGVAKGEVLAHSPQCKEGPTHQHKNSIAQSQWKPSVAESKKTTPNAMPRAGCGKARKN